MMRGICPSCGAELKFASKVTLYLVCRSCASLVVRKDLVIERVGAIAELQDDGSPIQIGTRGRFDGKPFEVIGRIQLQFESGYWNEWYLSSDGWLGEAQGTYMMTFRASLAGPLPSFDRLAPGKPVSVNGEAFQVREVQNARCIGGEGELPFRIESGYEAPVANLMTATSRCGTIDYSEDPPLVFLGHQLEFDALALSNLRRVEGW